METHLDLIVFGVALAMAVAIAGSMAHRVLQRKRADSAVSYTGLSRKDWDLLKEAILYAGESSETPSKLFDRLPVHLQDHEIGRIVAASLAGDPNADLDDAAKLMVGDIHNPWLALSKS